MLFTDLKGFKEIAHEFIGIMALGRHEAGIDEHHLVRAEVSYINFPASNSPGRWWRVSIHFVGESASAGGLRTSIASILYLKRV